MKLSEEQTQQVLSDLEVYKMLLRQWLHYWDVIEEWIQNESVYDGIDTLYDITKKELDPKTKTEVTRVHNG